MKYSTIKTLQTIKLLETYRDSLLNSTSISTEQWNSAFNASCAIVHKLDWVPEIVPELITVTDCNFYYQTTTYKTVTEILYATNCNSETIECYKSIDITK